MSEAWNAIETKAERLSGERGITKAAAMTAVLTAEPELYTRYLEDRMTAAATQSAAEAKRRQGLSEPSGTHAMARPASTSASQKRWKEWDGGGPAKILLSVAAYNGDMTREMSEVAHAYGITVEQLIGLNPGLRGAKGFHGWVRVAA